MVTVTFNNSNDRSAFIKTLQEFCELSNIKPTMTTYDDPIESCERFDVRIPQALTKEILAIKEPLNLKHELSKKQKELAEPSAKDAKLVPDSLARQSTTTSIESAQSPSLATALTAPGTHFGSQAAAHAATEDQKLVLSGGTGTRAKSADKETNTSLTQKSKGPLRLPPPIVDGRMQTAEEMQQSTLSTSSSAAPGTQL